MSELKLVDLDRIIAFDEASHKYTRNGKEYTSVSSFISQFKKPFDADFWAGRKATERGVSKAQILKEWDKAAKDSIARGKLFHSLMEYYLSTPNNLCMYSGHLIESYSEIISKIDDIIKHFKSEYDLDKTYCEVRLFSDKLQIAGMSDLILCNHKTKRCVILDYKTNKSLEDKVYNNFTGPLKHLEETKLNGYFVQLNMYAMLLWHCLEYKVDDMAIIHLDASNEVDCIQVPKLSEHVRALYNFRMQELLEFNLLT